MVLIALKNYRHVIAPLTGSGFKRRSNIFVI